MTHPKGYLVCIGGTEDNDTSTGKQELRFEKGILENVTALLHHDDPVIEVITAGAAHPAASYEPYKKAFEKLGCNRVGHIAIQERSDAFDPGFLQRIKACDAVVFTGCEGLRLCSLFGGSSLLDIILERYEEEEFVIAATSGSAAAMSYALICGCPEERAYMKGTVQLSPGFGFLHQVIVDTHFDKQGRIGRLAQAIAAQPGAVGIVLGEDSGVIVEAGHRIRAIGSSSVLVVDGHHLHHNNIADLNDGMPISMSNLKVHIMTQPDMFDLKGRSFIDVPVHHRVA